MRKELFLVNADFKGITAFNGDIGGSERNGDVRSARQSWLAQRFVDEGDADLATETPHHTAFVMLVLLDQQMELVRHVDAIDQQPGATSGNVNDHAIAWQRAGVGL
jgi:hypothetical protein